MTDNYTIAGRFMTLMCCGECGVEYMMPTAFYNECKRVGERKAFHCPNGHARVFAESTEDKMRRERDQLKQKLAEKDDEIQLQRSKAIEAEKEAERLKSRIGKGTCPCCNRHFVNLERHMKTKHGDKVVPMKKVARP